MKIIIYLLTICPLLIFGQTEYEYVHKIDGVEDLWHKLQLNQEVLNKVNKDFSDIRIYEISKTQDTLEIPYFIDKKIKKHSKQGVNFTIINTSHNNDTYYFTFKIKGDKTINEILLDFQQQNYNWKIELVASHDQKEWFNLLNDYRILSIQNNSTNYSFSKLKFPKANYKFFRISFQANETPQLKSVSINNNKEVSKNELQEYNNSFHLENKKNKQTVIEISLENRIPVSDIQLKFQDHIDYQRPIIIKYLTDSVKTQKGWVYNYRDISRDYISSLEENQFDFGTIFTNKIQITISNYDNQPLKIKSIKIRGPKYYLVARFLNTDNEHYLSYGDKNKQTPRYDIINFKDNIPKNLKEININAQIPIVNGIPQLEKSITTKLWLWVVILLIIALLGYSTLSMLHTKK